MKGLGGGEEGEVVAPNAVLGHIVAIAIPRAFIDISINKVKDRKIALIGGKERIKDRERSEVGKIGKSRGRKIGKIRGS